MSLPSASVADLGISKGRHRLRRRRHIRRKGVGAWSPWPPLNPPLFGDSVCAHSERVWMCLLSVNTRPATSIPARQGSFVPGRLKGTPCTRKRPGRREQNCLLFAHLPRFVASWISIAGSTPTCLDHAQVRLCLRKRVIERSFHAGNTRQHAL